MAVCIYCGSETIVHVNGVPVCPECDDDLAAGRTPPNQRDPKPPKAKGHTPRQ